MKKETPIDWMNHETQVVAHELKDEAENGTLPTPTDGPGARKHERERSANFYARRRAARGE